MIRKRSTVRDTVRDMNIIEWLLGVLLRCTHSNKNMCLLFATSSEVVNLDLARLRSRKQKSDHYERTN